MSPQTTFRPTSLFFTCLLALILSACGQSATPSTPTPVLAALTPAQQALDSYRTRGDLRVVVHQADGKTQKQVLHYETDWKKADNPYGFDLAARMVDQPAAGDKAAAARTISITAVGEDANLRLDEQGVTMTREEAGIDALSAVFTRPDSLAPEPGDLHYAGEETLNGIPTLHYTFDNPAFFDTFFVQEDASKRGVAQSLAGDVWVAKDGLYIVKLGFSADVKDRFGQDASGAPTRTEQTLSWNYDLYDINADFPIVLPADPLANASQPVISLPGFEPGSLLAPPGSIIDKTTGPFVVFKTEQLSEDEVTAYFEQRLAELGWTPAEGNPPVWTLGEYQLSLVTNETLDGLTRVMLSVETNAANE